MNKNNNIFNKNEIENELKNFKEGQDYSVSPTDEPNIKTYNFHNDKLTSIFRGDRVPVRITRKDYEGQDYTYRGHFEEGKDYFYSHQTWEGQNIPADENGWIPIRSEIYKGGSGDYTKFGLRFRPLDNFEPKKMEPSFNDKEVEMHRKYLAEFQEKKHNLEMLNIEEQNNPKSCCEEHLQAWLKSPNRPKLIEERKKEIEDIRPSDNNCQKCGALLCEEAKKVKSNLVKENQALRQELAEVKNQLAQVLEELKKLKSNVNGKDREKLNQQIVQNEKLIKEGENISLSEIQEQVNKSQALMKEFNVGVSSTKNDKGNSSLPYIIGGSVILAAVGIIGYFRLKNKRRYFAKGQK
ncbi:2292_t:CDS:2 [Ambispora leptoticha]|uniref:2292_t:CDS:1 n=1 Tax=Ambispora leptoticha TaxID=144679 RepID=A0A9N9EWY7_9GLOM|nr:2292_t:CDS:2 [Ambispora leptoticha]